MKDDKLLQENPIIIRKAVGLLVLKLATLQLVVFAVYIVARVTKTAIFATLFAVNASEGERLWTGVVFFLLLLALQTAIIGYIVLEWLHNFYELRGGSITHAWGVVAKRQEVYSLQNIEAGKVRQDVFSRLFGFGTVSFYSPVLKKEYTLTDIANPYEMKDMILGLIDDPRGREEKIIPIAGSADTQKLKR